MLLISKNYEPARITDLRELEKRPNVPFESYSYKILNVPPWLNKNYRYKAFTFNPYYVECTCDDYFKRAAIYPERDIMRVCVHLFYKYCSKNKKIPGYIYNVDSLTGLLLVDQFKYGSQSFYRLKIKNSIVHLGILSETEWINVYNKENSWFRFSYSIKFDRWADSLVRPYQRI